jgi:DNA-3-methyladenine glycosylase
MNSKSDIKTCFESAPKPKFSPPIYDVAKFTLLPMSQFMGCALVERVAQSKPLMPKLSRAFFARDTVTVARDLIGATLVVGPCAGRIVETEAYTTDAASHIVMRSRQALAMRDTFAYIYVYLIYGMYYCLNITTEREGPGAVLIRAVEPMRGIELMKERRGTDNLRLLTSGPGRLCIAFAIDLSFNSKPLGRDLNILQRKDEPSISVSRRIGITRAAELEWRFYETGNPFVSRHP